MNLQALKGIVPDAVLDQITDEFLTHYNCTNQIRLAHFLAQCAHESAGFKVVYENLYYNAHGLLAIFPSFFNADTANAFANKPEQIANKVYANRNGNGNEASGEGFKFRGRGYIQLTGKSNYIAFAKTTSDDIVSNPDLVATKYPLASAAFFFNTNGIWHVCDMGDVKDVVIAVTKRVNGGTNGLDDRLNWFNKIWSALKAG